MARTTKVLGFSVAPDIANEYERIAIRERTSKSELFRRMVETYKTRLEDEEFGNLQKRMSEHARRRRRLTEKEIERIVFEDR
jgi:isopropylmalate/homocitrate/citramalate synthase